MELRATRYEVDGRGVATVWMHRPDRGNAWTVRMHQELRWIHARLDPDPAVRVIVLTGTGPMFCAGADTKALDHYVEADRYDPDPPADTPTPGYGVRPELDADMVWQLGLATPTIAAVNGGCAGIAMALMAFCDLRIAVDDAKLTTAAPRLGLPAEYGLSWILPRLVGATRAADLLLTGRIVEAHELADWGLFNRVVPRDEFPAAVDEYAGLLAAASPSAVTTTKRQLWDDLLSLDPAASVHDSKRRIDAAMQGPDYAEGVAALRERRPPRFER
jgi:enoyl-CoA hydratase/carnithine racemase